jgi:hypothetical protein
MDSELTFEFEKSLPEGNIRCQGNEDTDRKDRPGLKDSADTVTKLSCKGSDVIKQGKKFHGECYDSTIYMANSGILGWLA